MTDGIAKEDNDLPRQVLYNEAEREKKALFGGREWTTILCVERLPIERVVACKSALSAAQRQVYGKDS